LKVIIVCYINIVKKFYKINKKMNIAEDSYFANNDFNFKKNLLFMPIPTNHILYYDIINIYHFHNHKLLPR